MRLLRCVVLTLLLICLSLSVHAQSDSLISSGSRPARPSVSAAGSPAYCLTAHTVGKLQLDLTNFGRLGYGNEPTFFDCFTGARLPMGEYPKGSNTVYLYKGGIWIGGVVGKDTLVSAGTDMDNWAREFNPEPAPFGEIERRSTLDPTSANYDQAVSEQDLIAFYTDTLTSGNPYPSFDAQESRTHKPLGVQVEQRSYAWSYGYADDFILFDCRVTNVGDKHIKSMYFGIYMDMDVSRYQVNAGTEMPGTAKTATGGRDDVTGFLFSYPASYTQHCDFTDTLNIAWTADNDGDVSWATNGFAVPNVTGVKFLREAEEGQTLSYNWWVPNYNAAYDFGPQAYSSYRQMSSGGSSPRSDRDKYHVLSNGEIDYAQPYTGTIRVFDTMWAYPNPDISRTIAKGGDNHWVLALGPFDLDPGASVGFPWVYVGAENWHYQPMNAHFNLTFGYRPKQYFQGLNMADLATNTVWAERIYDNPGVDTDNDGYAGKLRLCTLDSILVDSQWVPTAVESTYFAGDGIPDWRAATPPPPPKIWVSRIVNGVHIRFNGYQSETTRDFLSNLVDFEGYRVYLARDDREGSYSLTASYDKENYDVYLFNAAKKPKAGFDLAGEPETLHEIRCRFSAKSDPCNDSSFNPLDYTPANPYRSPLYVDTIAYFLPHDYNSSVLGVTTPIKKRFPDALKPVPGEPVTPDMLTDDGLLKYYEYECDVTGLLPTIPYWVNVTAFDFGSPKAGLAPLESSRTFGAIEAFAASTADQLDGTLPPVYVYPNPYRVDDKYRARSWEGRGEYDRIPDRVRAIWFANLPPKCTIRIYTLDGDLVRELRHDVPASDPTSSNDKWDLISRNVQMVVSGIYYWTVEDPDGKVQIGKLVIIM